MSLFNRNIGIDIGSSRIRIYKQNEGIVLDEPTAIVFDKEKGNSLVTGEKAIELKGKLVDEFKIVNPVVRGEIIDKKSLELILKSYFQKINPFFYFIKPTITVSSFSYSNSLNSMVVRDVCKNIGALNIYQIDELIAASVGAGIKISELRGRLVVNIGYGKTIAAAISLGGILHKDFIKIGGEDMNESISNYLKEKKRINIGFKLIEDIKKQIGSAIQLENPKEISIKARSLDDNLPKIVKISSNDIAVSINNDLEKITDLIKSVFSNVEPEINSDIIKKGIYLTGSVANLYGIDKFIASKIGINVLIAEKPSFSIINGIGKLLNIGHIDNHRRLILSNN